MRSIKAIFIGSVFILVTFPVMGLAYIFLAVGYNALAADYPFLHDITDIFRYLIGIPVFVMTLFAGGYITASVADMHANIKIWVHSLAVGLIAVGSMIYPTQGYFSLTITGIVLTVLALGASATGGFYWLRGQKKINQVGG